MSTVSTNVWWRERGGEREVGKGRRGEERGGEGKGGEGERGGEEEGDGTIPSI